MNDLASRFRERYESDQRARWRRIITVIFAVPGLCTTMLLLAQYTTNSDGTVRPVAPPIVHAIKLPANAVTVNAATSADQNLMAFTISGANAGIYLGAVNSTIAYYGKGTYTTGASGAGTMTYRLKLCTVSGCGSGTAITLATWGPTAAASASATSMPWEIAGEVSVAATGASGTLFGTGSLRVVLGTTATAAGVVHLDTNTAVSSAIDLTGQLFFQFCVSGAGASANNSFTQLKGRASLQ